MDTLRGSFSGRGHSDDDREYDYIEDDVTPEPPPSPVGQDERRMQVRAYNFWAGMLDNRTFPSIEDLDPENLPDFGPNSVLLDFTGGIEDPAIQFLGDKLAEECGATGPITRLGDVPSRSLLSRITDHYMQILANQAPIGFEAEFVNQRGLTILYRGILLPYSSDDDTIDFIYGVINWKEMADQQLTDELLLEIDQALEVAEPKRVEGPLTTWADGPADDLTLDLTDELPDDAADEPAGDAEVFDLTAPMELALDQPGEAEWPEPAFGAEARWDAPEWDMSVGDDQPADDFTNDFADGFTGEDADEDADDVLDLVDVAPVAPGSMNLADWLDSARELARQAQGSEERSRRALYAAIGRAYDFSVAAVSAPDEFAELVADAGLTIQERAPMTPVVKLVFGADYDKTRLTEYAAALNHAHRLGLGSGQLAEFLDQAPGGLKGVVGAERQLKKAESGKAVTPREAPRDGLARKLRKLEHRPLAEVAAEGSEFTLLVARRLANGEVVLLGEVAHDVPLLEKAAKQLLG